MSSYVSREILKAASAGTDRIRESVISRHGPNKVTPRRDVSKPKTSRGRPRTRLKRPHYLARVQDMATPQAFGLDPSVIEQIAEELTEAIVTRVVARLREDDVSRQATGEMAWLDAQEVARRLSVSREWVYEHADEMGASRIGFSRDNPAEQAGRGQDATT
jgi:hypothetical protein